MRVAALFAWVLAGCSASNFDGAGAQQPPPTEPGSGGAPGADEGCGVSLVADPTFPEAGPTTTVRIAAHVPSVSPSASYQWTALFQGAPADATPVAADPTQLDLRAPLPGVYEVIVDVLGMSVPCHGSLSLNVREPGARSQLLRLRIAAPRSLGAPPFEKTVQIFGGAAMDAGTLAIDLGVFADLSVASASGGLSAYVRFAPAGAPDAVVEAFSDPAGRVQIAVAAGSHTVLVIPRETDLPPRRFTGWSSSMTTLLLDAGLAVTGEVQDRTGAPLDGATVRLTIDGVPSTVATTAGGGKFALQAPTNPGSVILEVTPPDASGLPRFSATSSTLDLSQPLQIRYANNVALKDLAGIAVKRAGAPLAGAGVVLVGTLPVVGTVTAGATMASASGQIRIAAQTDASGELPATLVPAAKLSAVVTAAPGDLAVADLDATGALPASLEAPAMESIITAVSDPRGARLPGAVLDLVPTGALAMAAAPAIHAVA
ncbi:MAG TPA: carboxypeptidase-like regulatory domain-containing protein, partial [Kofleriaceae bacterium]|nr:carboxypeptidase-like regulatory domain-containing protein [Kofleriaceae bacterium]